MSSNKTYISYLSLRVLDYVLDYVIYEINEEINRINTIPFEKLDLMENYEIIGIKKQPYRQMFHYYLHLKYQKNIEI